MEESSPSATAIGVSLMRALHTRADPQPIINDPWGDKLIPQSVIEAIRELVISTPADASATVDKGSAEPDMDTWLRANPAFSHVLLRSRYTEDALHAAVARGVKQYVIIGAGFDSYALRVPAEAAHIEIFEVDHPATQSMKKQRLLECDLSVGESVHFLSANLANEALGDVLSNSSFNFSEPTFFSWLGVTMYLTREANMRALAEIARCSAPGSEVVFTYIDEKFFTAASLPESGTFNELQQSVASLGEPFLSGFNPDSIAQDLATLGLVVQDSTDDIAMLAQMDPTGINGLEAAARSYIARASVATE